MLGFGAHIRERTSESPRQSPGVPGQSRTLLLGLEPLPSEFMCWKFSPQCSRDEGGHYEVIKSPGLCSQKVSPDGRLLMLPDSRCKEHISVLHNLPSFRRSVTAAEEGQRQWLCSQGSWSLDRTLRKSVFWHPSF
jgi:hypothetical protein